MTIIGLLNKVIWAWKVHQASWIADILEDMIFDLASLEDTKGHWKKNLFSATNSQQLLKQKPHNVIGTGPRVLGNVKR